MAALELRISQRTTLSFLLSYRHQSVIKGQNAMSTVGQDVLSASSDTADAIWIKMMTWWSPEYQKHHHQTPQSTLQLIYNPRLPPLLSPLPNLFRFIAFLILAPIAFLCLVDFAGYAVFRTLGESIFYYVED
jgi:hypothetical protein